MIGLCSWLFAHQMLLKLPYCEAETGLGLGMAWECGCRNNLGMRLEDCIAWE